MNDLEKYASIFADIQPWSGTVPAGFIVDFLGTLTAKDFLGPWGHHPLFVDGNQLTVPRPTLDGVDKNCEFWFEAADWVLAAREARERFVMVTLGALYGYQAVGSQRALQRLNPMPSKLVAVEPIPQNMAWVRRHMIDNGIDPEAQWLIEAAISDRNEPVFFPVGSPGLGAQNCIATNERDARQRYFQEFVAQGRTEEALRNLLLRNTTGLEMDIIAGQGHMGEIKLISSVNSGRRSRAVFTGGFSRSRYSAIGDRRLSPVHRPSEKEGSQDSPGHARSRRASGLARFVCRQGVGDRVQLRP